MSAPATAYPFTAFNFSVEITRDGESSPLCSAAFAECDGLEMTMEVKTIREGGNNDRQIRLSGPAAYGQLTLKRGMTSAFDLWKWFADTVADPALRADAEVVVRAADGVATRARFKLSRCVPVKLKAPPLNAKDGAVAIEELQVAYEQLELAAPGSLP
jgi:phage tail-like protein